MKKSSLFISVALTTFILAVLAGVVVAFQTTSSPATQAATAQSAAIVQVAAPATGIQPEQAASIAASYLGRSDLYTVENAWLDGASVWLVTFSSGDQVYISPAGDVLSVVAAPAAISQNATPATSSARPVLPVFGGDDEGDDHD